MIIRKGCFECFLKTARKNAEKMKFSKEDTEKLVKKTEEYSEIVKKRIKKENSVISPAEAASDSLWKYFHELSGSDDPFLEIKNESNKNASKVIPLLPDIIKKSKNELYTVCLLAAMGNLLDFGLEASYTVKLEEELEKIKTGKEKFISTDKDDFELFSKKLKIAKKIMLIVDNSGEIIFDKFMIEYFLEKYPSIKSVIVAVRGHPIINDVTEEDAKSIGFHKIPKVTIVKSSNDRICGTVLSRCTKEFLDHFKTSDVIISKGMGNFETMGRIPRENGGENLFLLLKAKCKSVADYCKVPYLSSVFTRPLPKEEEIELDW